MPVGNILAGTIPAVVVGTPLAHPWDVVEVLLRREDGPIRVLRAMREPGMQGAVQWFRAILPALQPGEQNQYRVEWSRAGRRMAMLPADGSWYSVNGVAEPSEREAAARAGTDAGSEWASRPRFAHDLEFFAALTVNLRAEILGATPEGYRINFYAKGGRVRGPRIDAVVQPEGGDWMCIRPDGIGAVHIKITYQTTDGALILEEAGGVFDIGPDGYAKVAAGVFVGAPPFYATPTWSTAHPAWKWLNRCQGFGFGRVVMDKLQVQCDIYLPHVGERTGHG